MQKEQENLRFGYVCLHRSIRKNWIWEDADRFKWWIDILLEVNHQPAKVLIKGTLLDCNRGESLNSLQTWALRWRTNVSAVRRFFDLLSKDGMITMKNEGKTTRLTVCNYDTYNGDRHADDTQTDTPKKRRPAPEAPVLELEYTEEQKTNFKRFTDWIETHAPTVARMKNPFTIREYLYLKTRHSWKEIADILEQMDSWEKLLTKRTDAFKTFKTFHNRRKEQPQKVA